LTVYIVKTTEPIYVIFGIIQRGIVLNTSVKSVLNNFITQVAPPTHKINNSGFHLQDQPRPPDVESNDLRQVVHTPVPLYGVVGRVDSAFESCLKDTRSNPAEAGHCVTTVGKLFTLIAPSGAEIRLNQLTRGTAGSSVATLTCVGSGLLSLSSLIGG